MHVRHSAIPWEVPWRASSSHTLHSTVELHLIVQPGNYLLTKCLWVTSSMPSPPHVNLMPLSSSLLPKVALSPLHDSLPLHHLEVWFSSCLSKNSPAPDTLSQACPGSSPLQLTPNKRLRSASPEDQTSLSAKRERLPTSLWLLCVLNSVLFSCHQ